MCRAQRRRAQHLLASEERQSEMAHGGLWLWVTFHRFLTPGLGLAATDSLFCNLAGAGGSWNPQGEWARRLPILLKACISGLSLHCLSPSKCPYLRPTLEEAEVFLFYFCRSVQCEGVGYYRTQLPSSLEEGLLKSEPKFSSVACWACGFDPQLPYRL